MRMGWLLQPLQIHSIVPSLSVLSPIFERLVRVSTLLGATLDNGWWSILVADRSTRSTATLDALDHPHTLLVTWHDLAEDDVTTVEPRSDDGSDEELAAIGIRAGVSHGEEERLVVLEFEVLVGKLLTVNRLAAGALCHVVSNAYIRLNPGH